MAIGIDGIDFSDTQRHFNIILEQSDRPFNQPPTKTVIPLSSCRSEDWVDLGTDFDKYF